MCPCAVSRIPNHRNNTRITTAAMCPCAVSRIPNQSNNTRVTIQQQCVLVPYPGYLTICSNNTLVTTAENGIEFAEIVFSKVHRHCDNQLLRTCPTI